MESSFDFGIIGSGPAGFTLALLAVKKGLSVVLFEKDKIGGVCLNKGCIPTKTIMHSAELYKDIKNAENIGIIAHDVAFDFAKVMERKNKVTEMLRNALTKNLQSKGVKIVEAEAKVVANNTIEVDGDTFNCEKIVLATGSEPRALKGCDFDHKFILNSDDLFEMKEAPKSVVIIGAGAEGIEWARIFKDIGVDVTIVEATPRVLSVADEEVSKYVERILKMRKIGLKLSTMVEGIEDKKVKLSNGEVLEPDCVLVAIGRIPNKQDVKADVTYLGDASGELMLANYGMYQARALMSEASLDDVLVPSVVYGIPEIAWVGVNEQDLEAGSYKKSVVPIRTLGKAHCDNDIDGFIKVLSKDNKIVGAHIISKEASAMIHEFVIAMQNGISPEELKKVCFAHPTYSEGVYESILAL